jgi:hypothetical protein
MSLTSIAQQVKCVKRVDVEGQCSYVGSSWLSASLTTAAQNCLGVLLRTGSCVYYSTDGKLPVGTVWFGAASSACIALAVRPLCEASTYRKSTVL